jgi:hypothetical protein
VSDELQLYRCTPRQTRIFVTDVIRAGLVPFVQSSPGMGKSAIMRSIADTFNLWLIDHRLSTSAPEDLSGLPEFFTDTAGIRRARFCPFDIFPVEGTPIPDGKDGWMLFLDEANSGTKMVQAASYKLILDKMVGQNRLHERVAITMAGNLMTDRAIVNPLSTAMQSRVIHIEMIINFLEWLEDVAFKEKYDDRIIAFLNWKESYLMDFRPDHQDKTFCSPRTWEFMNRLILGQEVTLEKTGLYAGTVTSGVAVEFVQFCQIYHDLITIADVLRDPDGTPVPRDPERRWAITSHLMGQADEKNFGDICRFINRMDMSFRVLFFRGLLAQQPKLRTHPAFAKAMIELQAYLNPKKNP